MDKTAQNYYADQEPQQDPYYAQREHTFLNKVHYIAVQIWPYVMKVINFIVYETIKLTRIIVKLVIEQLRFR